MVVLARASAERAACPACGTTSGRMHSRYGRSPGQGASAHRHGTILIRADSAGDAKAFLAHIRALRWIKPPASDACLPPLPVHAARLDLSLTAVDLLACPQALSLDGELTTAEPKKLRHRLPCAAARITRTEAAASVCGSPPPGPGDMHWQTPSPTGKSCRDRPPDQRHCLCPAAT